MTALSNWNRPVNPVSLREQIPEPASLWIRHSFSRWPIGDRDELWCDLATGGLLSSSPPPTGPLLDPDRAALSVRTVTDVVYVPPLAADYGPLRERIVRAAAAVGAPLVVQVVAEDVLTASTCGARFLRGPAAAADWLPRNAVVAVDLLDCVLRQASVLLEEPGESRQHGLPFETAPARLATLVWPLVVGWTDQPAVLRPAMVRLAAAGARRVVPRTLDLDARSRRLLAGRLQSTWPEAFDALFHGDDSPPDTEAFRTAATAAGLEHRLPRPLPARPLPPRLRRARELAGHLIELGDAATAGSDAYYRAARFLDGGDVDIEAAAREGNLGVLPWLEAPAREATEEWLAARRRE